MIHVVKSTNIFRNKRGFFKRHGTDINDIHNKTYLLVEKQSLKMNISLIFSLQRKRHIIYYFVDYKKKLFPLSLI